MNAKLTAILCACLLAALPLHSQEFFSTQKSTEPITLSVRGGFNLSKWAYSVDLSSENGKAKVIPGLNIGVSVDIPFLESLYLQPGFYFTMKGNKYTASRESNAWGHHVEKYWEKSNPTYLEIPILASYRYKISESMELQVNAGPYLAVGLGGKTKGQAEMDGDALGGGSDWPDEKFFEYNKRFDAGLQFGAGLQFSRFYAGIAYDLGLTNVLKDNPAMSVKNRTFTLNVGYRFNL